MKRAIYSILFSGLHLLGLLWIESFCSVIIIWYVDYKEQPNIWLMLIVTVILGLVLHHILLRLLERLMPLPKGLIVSWAVLDFLFTAMFLLAMLILSKYITSMSSLHIAEIISVQFVIAASGILSLRYRC